LSCYEAKEDNGFTSALTSPKKRPSIQARKSIREAGRGASGDLLGLSGEAMCCEVDGHVHGPECLDPEKGDWRYMSKSIRDKEAKHKAVYSQSI
jgi:hypothetical protein